MPIYNYKALKKGREVVSGNIVASDFKDAKDLIRKMGLVPTEVKQADESKASKSARISSLSLA